MQPETIRLIGVDPGLRRTGYGVIETDGYRHRYQASGQICPAQGPIPERLGELFRQLSEVLEVYAPDCAVVEASFVSANAGTALKLGQARGALISACVVREVEVFEYSPRSMKQAVTGRGGATKEQVQFMVQRLLGLAESPQADEADALGLALCHAHSRLLTPQECST
ncbi:MAG: crossover junction endodeoxyribonuclease RuvC [Gammaproteobacteria bacterium]|nr:crossover junction endodeoxyribonuclease RuvC [Gammaproteobacteria bacterium]